jgi:mitogen-activated protein kinase kinase kinase 1
LLHALKIMHDKGYVHRDIKLENILLDENFKPKVADFGFCELIKISDDGDNFIDKKGTY